MATRTTIQAVRDIIGTDEDLSITPFIRTANILTNWLDGQDTDNELDDDTLTEIETWLAAHFYAHRDQLLASANTGASGGSFQGDTGKNLDSTLYGQTAMLLDTTGNLTRLSLGVEDGKKTASLTWAGTASDSPRPDGLNT